MDIEHPSDETTVVAVYSSRHDAEVARSMLESRRIRAFVAADDVHPPMQATEGARLIVMARNAAKAFAVLEEAEMLPRSVKMDEAEVRSRRRPIGLTAWLFLIAFILVLILLAIGSLF